MRERLDLKSGVQQLMLSGFKAYVWLFAGLFIFYLILSPFVILKGTSGMVAVATDPYDGDTRVGLVMAALLFILLAVALIITCRRQMTAGRLVFLIVLAGIVLRFGYMLYTPFYIRGHDVSTLNGFGHVGYMYRLFNLEGLPEVNTGQFYHPPFEHIAGAAIAKIYALLTEAKNPDTIFEASKLVPCFASCAVLIVSLRLFKEFDFSKRAKVIAVAVIAFQPTFIILAASINNDMLMVFFFLTAFLYTIRWYKDPTYKNILLVAISIGCAMSTKFSGSLVAFFTAFVFLIVLIRKIREQKAGFLVNQFAAFAAVCIPLGLWYHIRNLKLFGQGIGYVAQLTPASPLYVGDKSFAERFFAFSLPEILRHPFCNPYEDFRLWEYTVKCALFGEFAFSPKHNVFAVILIVSSLLLIILSLIAMVWLLFFDKKKNRLAVLSLGAIWVLLMVSFVVFNITYPYGCTMDFRYIVPTVITGAAFLSLLSDKLTGGKMRKAAFICLIVILVIFCISASGFYIV